MIQNQPEYHTLYELCMGNIEMTKFKNEKQSGKIESKTSQILPTFFNMFHSEFHKSCMYMILRYRDVACREASGINWCFGSIESRSKFYNFFTVIFCAHVIWAEASTTGPLHLMWSWASSFETFLSLWTILVTHHHHHHHHQLNVPFFQD